MPKTELPELSLNNLLRINDIFRMHNWAIDEKNYNSRFMKYMHLLNQLDDNEQKLILELTERFLHIKHGDYFEYLLPAIRSLLENNPDVTQYYVVPALAREDINKTGKSSQMIQYLFKGDSLDETLNLQGINFRVIEKIENLLTREHPLKRHERILFVDDFIGSGDTALEAVKIFDGTIIQDKDIIFLAIVVHNMGKCLLSENFSVYYSEFVNKGITDFYSDDELTVKTDIMKRIENRITIIKDEYRFGYKQCEALVHMHRIPNNSFPIYWLDKNISPYKR